LQTPGDSQSFRSDLCWLPSDFLFHHFLQLEWLAPFGLNPHLDAIPKGLAP
jgi:hypothetical protein